jgi:hypothetical protein
MTFRPWVIVTSLMLLPGVAVAVPLFEQLPGPDSPATIISSTLNNLSGIPGFHVADNFQITGGGTVHTVQWWGKLRSGGEDFEITFYPDAAGNPGAPLATIDVTPTSSTDTTGSSFDPVTFYSAILSTPFNAAPGTKYWVSVFDAAPDGRWVWLSAEADTFDGRQRRNDLATWNITDDVSFRLTDDVAVVPEPGTLALCGGSFAVLALLRRRRISENNETVLARFDSAMTTASASTRAATSTPD